MFIFFLISLISAAHDWCRDVIISSLFAGMRWLLLVVLFPVKPIEKSPAAALSFRLLIISKEWSLFIWGGKIWLDLIFHFSISLVSRGPVLEKVCFSALRWYTLHPWREQTFHITIWAHSVGYWSAEFSVCSSASFITEQIPPQWTSKLATPSALNIPSTRGTNRMCMAFLSPSSSRSQRALQTA